MPTAQEGGKVRYGAEVTPDIQHVLTGCPTPDAIVDNLDVFNAEIQESHTQFLVDSSAAKREAEITLIRARQKLGIKVAEPKKKRTLSSKAKKEKIPVKPPPLEIKRRDTVASQPLEVKEITNIKQPVKVQPVKQEEKMPSLEDDLNGLEEQVEKELEAEQPQFGVTRSRVMEALSKIPGAPSERQIAHWKQEHGSDGVHVTVFSEREIYIYKHLTRAQWQKVQDTIAKIQAAKAVSEDDLKEKVVSHCMLWPQLTVEFKHNSRAGVIDALYSSILLNSFFLNPQQIMQLTTEL